MLIPFNLPGFNPQMTSPYPLSSAPSTRDQFYNQSHILPTYRLLPVPALVTPGSGIGTTSKASTSVVTITSGGSSNVPGPPGPPGPAGSSNLLYWVVPGTLVTDSTPGGSAAPIALPAPVASIVFVAQVVVAPTGHDIVVDIGKTTSGTRIVVDTLTIPIGSVISAPSSSLSFAAVDVVDIEIMSVGTTQPGEGLVVGTP